MPHPRQQRRPNSFHDRPRYNPGARAGLVMTRGMDFGGFGNAEQVLFQAGVAMAPVACGEPRASAAPLTVLPTAGLKDLQDGRLAGLVVPGGDDQPDASAVRSFDALVSAARKGGLPILAFADGVPRVLASLGFETDRALPAAVLVQDGVRILETGEELQDAANAFKAPVKAAA